MAQPPIRNMMLGAVCDGQRVNVGTVPHGVRWKQVSMTDVIRMDDVYAAPDAKPAAAVDGAGMKWKDCSVCANVTLTSRAPATEVPAAFLMRAKLPWVSLMMKNLSDAQAAALRTVPGMGRTRIQSAKNARGELQEYVVANPQRCQEVKGHIA